MTNWNDLEYIEKFALIRLYPEEAKKDENWRMRLEAYERLGFTEEAKKDKSEWVRREAYRYLGFTDEDIGQEIEILLKHFVRKK